RLLRFFAARALEKMYKRTIRGRLWLIIRPVVPLLVATLIFGSVLGIQTGIPDPLFFITGMTCWSLFSKALLWATRSLELNRKVLTRLYFPRLILPVSMTAPAWLEVFFFLAFMIGTGVYYSLRDGTAYFLWSPRLLVAPIALLLSALFALGIGLWTSVLGAGARDVRFTLAYVMDAWLYFTPVIYPISFVPERWQWLLALNPMATLVEAFKWATLGTGRLDLSSVAISLGIIAATFAGGLRYFNRAEAASIDRL
ncbi:MAG TPA: ABC transporter permease, partial [Planctomycetota bacterium]|nr:ABC transporter permease [Planctomycetota bacterium]